MKRSLLLLLSATVLIFAGCAKKECCVFPPAPNFILAQKNSVEWKGDPSDSVIQGDTILVTGNYNNAGQEEVLGFKLVYDGLGYYTLKNNEGHYHVTKGGTRVSTYALSPRHPNTVTVFAYNESEKILQGYFELKFVKIYNAPAQTQPDSISFLSGKFKVALHN